MPTPFEDASKYLDQAITEAGFLPNIKARESMRVDVENNYGSHYLSAILKDVVARHAHMLVKKPAEPVAPAAPVQQNAAAVNAHVAEVLRQLSAEFPDVNFYSSVHNNKVLGEYVDSLGGGITMVALRTGVRLLYSMLEKNPPPPPPVVPESEPLEELKILSDGTRQLSINATDADLRDPSVSKVQLKDWLRRKDNKKYGGFDGRL